MCIAILKPQGKILSEETLTTCFEYNSDGAGFMYAQDKVLHVSKGFFTIEEFLAAYKEHEEKKCVLHFRIKTHGVVDVDNCHPFLVSNELGLVHNGIISVEEKDKEKSDTWHFNENICKPMYKIDKHFYFKKHNIKLIEKYIGRSKLVFMNRRGETTIVNPEMGIWDEGVWYSNSSYIPPKKTYIQPSNVHSFYSTSYVENDWAMLKYNVAPFKKGDVVCVEEVYPNRKVKVSMHRFLGNNQTEVLSGVLHTAVLESIYQDEVYGLSNFYS